MTKLTSSFFSNNGSLFFKKSSRLYLSIAFGLFISFVFLYLLVAPSTVTRANNGGDGGDFITAILTRGIPHPTGYPTYILLGRIFQLFPWGTPYFRGVLVSLVPSALSIGLFFLLIVSLINGTPAKKILAGCVASLSLGTSVLLWSQSVIIEVHGLQSLFLVNSIAWIILNFIPNQSKTINVFRYLLALSYGFGLGNHVTLIFLFPPILFSLYWSLQKKAGLKNVLVQFVLILTGSLVYLYFPIAAHDYPPVNWGNPQTWEGFYWVVSGKPYQNFLFSGTFQQTIERILNWFTLVIHQFGVIGTIFALVGAVQFNFSDRKVDKVFLWCVLLYSIFTVGYNTSDSTTYLLPVILAFSAWIGLTISKILDWKWKKIPVGLFISLIAIGNILFRIPATMVEIDPRRDEATQQFAEEAMRDAPKGAIIYTQTEADSFPLWYYHFGLKQRTDLIVIVLPLTQFNWYRDTLMHTYPNLVYPPIDSKYEGAEWGSMIEKINLGRAVCHCVQDPNKPNKLVLGCTQ